MSLVLLWSKRQPRTPGFSLLGATFCSGPLRHLMWRLTWLHICTCESLRVWTLCRPEGACYLAVPERSLLFLFLYKSYFFSRQWLISWRSGEDFCQFGAKPLTSTLWIIYVECNFASTWKSRTYKKGWMCSIFILFETTCLTIDEICAYVKGLEISEVYNDISNHQKIHPPRITPTVSILVYSC